MYQYWLINYNKCTHYCKMLIKETVFEDIWDSLYYLFDISEKLELLKDKVYKK